MKQKTAVRLTLLYTALFTLLAHGYRYLSLSFSGDSMLLSQVGEEAYQTSLGRFLQPVYWQIRGYITAPLLIGLFAAAFLAASALIVVRLLRLERPLHIALVCGVLTANETMAVSNASYLPWTDVYALALLFSLLGAYALFEMKRGVFIAPVCFCLSLGLYQSYLPAASTMVILVLLLRTLDGERPGLVWKQGLLAILSLLAGLVLYAAALKLSLAVVGAQASNDYNGVGNVGLMALSDVPRLLLETYLTPFRLLLGLSEQPAMTWHITTVPKALNILLFGLALLGLAVHAGWIGPARSLTALFLLAVLPLGMNFVQFISNGVASGLTIYSYNLLYLLPIALLARMDTRRLVRPFALGAGACLCAFLLLNIRTANEMAFKRDLEFSATTAAMSRVLDRAERTEGYVPGETPVVLIGMLPSSAIAMERPGFETIARAQGMRYTYSAAYETSNYWYLRMALGEPINLVSHEERVRLSEDPRAKALPAFPKDGCCRMIDGALFIRIH